MAGADGRADMRRIQQHITQIEQTLTELQKWPRALEQTRALRTAGLQKRRAALARQLQALEQEP